MRRSQRLAWRISRSNPGALPSVSKKYCCACVVWRLGFKKLGPSKINSLPLACVGTTQSWPGRGTSLPAKSLLGITKVKRPEKFELLSAFGSVKTAVWRKVQAFSVRRVTKCAKFGDRRNTCEIHDKQHVLPRRHNRAGQGSREHHVPLFLCRTQEVGGRSGKFGVKHSAAFWA